MSPRSFLKLIGGFVPPEITFAFTSLRDVVETEAIFVSHDNPSFEINIGDS
jgi:hypothetical protein